MIRVAVFDDNDARREGLKLLLEAMEDMQCVGAYPDCREAVARVRIIQPDVILMDIDMPHVNGIEGTERIKGAFPDKKVIIQTVFEDEDKLLQAISAGADGYILKQKSPMKLIEGVIEVMNGGAPMTPIIARKVLSLFSSIQKKPKVSDIRLTKRETEILNLLVKGYSYDQIAEQCFISYATVNTHVSHIYKKLQVKSVAAAVAKALQEGLV